MEIVGREPMWVGCVHGGGGVGRGREDVPVPACPVVSLVKCSLPDFQLWCSWWDSCGPWWFLFDSQWCWDEWSTSGVS